MGDADLLPWATLAARRRVLETLRRDAGVPLSRVERLHVEPGLYAAVFDVALARERAGVRASGVARWAQETVAFRFADTRGGGSLAWPPPRTERTRGRLFEVQDDGYLCGLHALNNVARALVLDPPGLLSAIGTLRPAGDFDRTRDITLYAQRDELFLAALRRGIVLAPLALSALEDLDSLRGDASKYPLRKCVERLLRDAGGLLVLAPGDGGRGGHWVPLVPSPQDGRWLIYSFNKVIVDEPTVGDALRRFLELRGGVAGSSARATLSALQLAGAEYVALVPLHAACDEDKRAYNDAELPRLARAVARYWARSVLANAQLVSGRDIEFPQPLTSPLALHHVCNALTNGHALGASLFRRLTTQFALDVDLNSAANELAGELVADDEQELRNALRRLRSLLREVRGTGLMLDTERDGALTSDTWLRYAALLLATRGVERRLDAGDRERALQCARLIAIVAFSDLRAAGDTAVRYEALEPFWRALINVPARRAALPPTDDAAVRAEFLEQRNFISAQLYAIGGGAPMARYLLGACAALADDTVRTLGDDTLLEYVRARAFASPSLRGALDWRADGNLRRAVAPELARRLGQMERELRGSGATVASLARQYARQAEQLLAEPTRLALATREAGRSASMRVRRVANTLGLAEPAALLAQFDAAIAGALGAPTSAAVRAAALDALRTLGAFDEQLRAFHLGALDITDALAFTLRYDEYFDALEAGRADALLADIAAQAQDDDARKAQQIEQLFVNDGAESVYGLVLDRPPTFEAPTVSVPRVLPRTAFEPLSALRDNDDDDGFVIVGSKNRRRR